jgi:hypothetical protein
MVNIFGTKTTLYVIGAVFLALAVFIYVRADAASGKTSALGQYKGYSQAVYDGSRRSSDYLPLPNGTKLAYDLILPTKNGKPAAERLPVLFKYTPYLRTFTLFDQNGRNVIADLMALGWKERAMLRVRYWLSPEGRYMDPLFRTPWLKNMVEHGYAVIVVERPGTGASFGSWDPTHETGGQEASAIMNWIAAQPWSNGKIGMYGDSFQAMIQMAAAAQGNTHLKAIFPTSAPLEMYNGITYPGGVYNTAFNAFFKWATTFLQADTVTPVDSDKDGQLLARAQAERARSLPETINFAKDYPYRDSLGPLKIKIWEGPSALYPFIERINRAGVPIYMTNGWFDIFTADMFFWYKNLTVPRRLIVRPLDHSEIEKNSPDDLDFGAEAHRWFDYWLKGIDNGIMKEPPIHYYSMEAAKKGMWRTAIEWPPAGRKSSRFYFAGGKTGSIDSANDGFLLTSPPAERVASAIYTVDYTMSTGRHSRWSAVNWARQYPDMRANDKKGLTYTTAPLKEDLNVTGHPVVRLWLTTDAANLDVFVYLEDVAPSGRSDYITEGVLRATHRKLGRAPFDNLGLPFQSHYQSDQTPIPAGEPFAMIFSLLPTSYKFPQGHRVRITVAFADADNFATPAISPAPQVRLLMDNAHVSFVDM